MNKTSVPTSVQATKTFFEDNKPFTYEGFEPPFQGNRQVIESMLERLDNTLDLLNSEQIELAIEYNEVLGKFNESKAVEQSIRERIAVLEDVLANLVEHQPIFNS